jgi:DNA polymerase III subunit epsilon
MYLLGIDLETTGIDPSSSDIIEVGYLVWDTKSACPITLGSELVKIETPLPAEVKTLTGISEKHLSSFGISLKRAIGSLADLAKGCDFLVGHNAINFDRKFLAKACKEFKIEFPAKYWIDSMIDIPYPASIKTRKLDYLAVEHKVPIVNSHRAAFDILVTMQILEKYNWETIAERAKTGFIKLIADVSYEDRTKASSRGFKWDADAKVWFMTIRAYDAKNLNFDFPIKSEVLENNGVKGC